MQQLSSGKQNNNDRTDKKRIKFQLENVAVASQAYYYYTSQQYVFVHITDRDSSMSDSRPPAVAR